MNYIRFEHINLSCQDIEITKKFYQTIFPDWYVRAEGIFKGRPWIHLGDNQFYVTLNGNPQQERVHQAYDHIGINHIGFVIQDGEAMMKMLDAEGIEYYTLTASETKHRIYVSDPDGNEIELVEYQPDYPLK